MLLLLTLTFVLQLAGTVITLYLTKHVTGFRLWFVVIIILGMMSARGYVTMAGYMGNPEEYPLNLSYEIFSFIIALLIFVILVFVAPLLTKTDQIHSLLTESRSLFNLAFRIAPLGILVFNRETGILIDANKAWLKRTGYRRNEILGKTPQELGLWDRFVDVNMMEADLDKLKRTKIKEFPYKTKSGEPRIAEVNTYIIKSDKGHNVICVCQDRTDEYRRANALEVLAKRYNALIQNAGGGLVLTDEAGKVIEWSPKQESITQISKDAAFGNHLYTILERRYSSSENSIANTTNLVTELKNYFFRQDGKWSNPQSEFSLKDPEGNTRIIYQHGFPIASEQGWAMMWVSQDVTEIRKREFLIAQQEERYTTLFESSPSPILIIDVDTLRIIDANHAAESLLLMSKEELLSKKIMDLSPEEELTHFKEIFREDPMQEYPLRTMVTKVRRKHGMILPVDLAVRGIHVNDRLCSQIVIRDLSSFEETLHKAIDFNRKEATKTLAAGVAHDINNLMASVLGNTELLEMDTDFAKEQKELLRAINRGALRASDLAKQLLAYARGGTYQLAKVDLNEVIAEVLQVHLLERSDTVAFELDLHRPLATFVADRTQIVQMVLNLLENSIEAMTSSGTIKLSTSLAINSTLDETDILFSVRDDGHGMSTLVKERIFEPFFTTRFHGRGLGMSAVYGIVAELRGSIKIISEEGKGAEVNIRIPVGKPSRQR